MSMRFNLCSGGLLAASVIAGLTMGGYATRVPLVPDAPSYAMQDDRAADSVTSDPTIDAAPGAIVCKGCGPTLAERRMAQDQAGLDADSYIAGSRDPVVVDYMRAEVAEVVPTSQPQMLPAAVQRPVAPPPVVVSLRGEAPPANDQP